MCFTKCSSKCCKIYRKTRVPESVFNKVKLATLLKKRLWHRRFPVNFSKLVRPTFLWNISGWVLLNADYWKTPRDYWSKISFFSPLRFLILKNSILMELFMRRKNFIFKLFTKERKIPSEFSEIFALLSMFFMFDHCWKGCKPFINICYLHDFFPCSFHVILALVEVMVSMGVFIYISVPFEYLMKNCVD